MISFNGCVPHLHAYMYTFVKIKKRIILQYANAQSGKIMKGLVINLRKQNSCWVTSYMQGTTKEKADHYGGKGDVLQDVHVADKLAKVVKSSWSTHIFVGGGSTLEYFQLFKCK